MLGRTTQSTTLADLETPCLLLDETQMMRNVARLRTHLDCLGGPLRAHLK